MNISLNSAGHTWSFLNKVGQAEILIHIGQTQTKKFSYLFMLTSGSTWFISTLLESNL